MDTESLIAFYSIAFGMATGIMYHETIGGILALLWVLGAAR